MNEEGKVLNSNNCMKPDHLHTLLYRVRLWKYSELNVVYMYEDICCVTSVRIGYLALVTITGTSLTLRDQVGYTAPRKVRAL